MLQSNNRDPSRFLFHEGRVEGGNEDTLGSASGQAAADIPTNPALSLRATEQEWEWADTASPFSTVSATAAIHTFPKTGPNLGEDLVLTSGCHSVHRRAA